MAIVNTIPISELPETITLASNDEFLVNQSDSVRKISWQNLYNRVSEACNMPEMNAQIAKLFKEIEKKIESMSSHWMYANNLCSTFPQANPPGFDADNPLFLYAIYQDVSASVCSAYAYEVLSAMDTVFRKNVMPTISVLNFRCENLTAYSAFLSNAYVTDANITNLSGTTATFKGLSATENLNATKGTFKTSLTVNSLSSTSLTSTNAKTTNLTATNLTATNTLSANSGSFGTLSATTLCADNFQTPGQDGQIMYLTPTGDVIKQEILNTDVYVCESQSDVDRTMTANTSLKDVFTSWKQGGCRHDSNVSPPRGRLWYGYSTGYPEAVSDMYEVFGDDYDILLSGTYADLVQLSRSKTLINNQSGYRYWVYNETLSSVLNPCNTNDWSFFISPFECENFDVTIRCYSLGADDDEIGIGIFSDKTDAPHTLSFLRTPALCGIYDTTILRASHHWYACYDIQMQYNESNKKNTYILSTIPMTEDMSGNWNMGTISAGTYIRMRKEGTRLSGWTTAFTSNQTTDNLGHMMSFNLDTQNQEIWNKNQHASGENTTVDLSGPFSGPVRICIGAQSQPYTLFEVVDFKIPKTIAYNNHLCSYNPLEGTWTEVEESPYQKCGIGRICKNIATKKCFYVQPDNFLRLAETNYNTEEWSFKTESDEYITKTVCLGET